MTAPSTTGSERAVRQRPAKSPPPAPTAPAEERPGSEQARADPGSTALEAGLPWRPLVWVSVVTALLVAMAEISRLSGSVLDATGRAWAVADLMGPSALALRDGWLSSYAGSRTWLWSLRTYLILDVGFIVLYLAALRHIIRRRYLNGTQRGLLFLMWVLVGLDVIEDVTAWWATAAQAFTPTRALVLAAVSLVKCVLGAAAAFVGAYGVLTVNGQSLTTNLRLVYEVLRKHRLSLIPLLVLAVVAVAPGAEILDQVPNIERRWADGPGNFWSEGMPGLLALLVMALGLLLLGRARTQVACRDFDGEQPDPADDPDPCANPDLRAPDRLWLWLIGPAGVFATAVLVRLAGGDVVWSRVLTFCAVPVAIWASSSFYRWRIRKNRPALWQPHPPKRWSRAELQLLLRTGDGIALAVLVVGALGAVRSMTAIVMLGAFGVVPVNSRAWVLLVLGAVGAPAVWLLAAAAYRVLTNAYSRWPTLPEGRLARWLAPRCGEQDPVMLRRFPAVALGAALLLFAAMAMVPAGFGRLGVLCTFVLSILAVTGIVACAGLVAARHPVAEVFQRIHLRSTPVLTLLLLAVIVAGQVGARTPIHAVQTESSAAAAGGASAPRPDLATSIQTWANAQVLNGCTRPVAGGERPLEILPMVMIAAEGGGIRAAYWTVQSAQRLAADPCARTSTVFSSGVSGGAVGLAVLRYNRNPTDVVREMSNSRALSYGLVGLFVRDFGYAATGVPLPDLNRDDDPMTWTDRSALMEDAWNSSAAAPDTWQDQPFLGPPASPSQGRQPTVGPVILNSMSVGNACRVWVSEIRLRPVDDRVAGDGDGKINCDQGHAAGVRSIDLISAYGSETGAPADQAAGCLNGLSAATAAMLAARFPYVTPSGRIGPCTRPDGSTSPVDQLVDGGYLENTGLGTINDLADSWLPAVQQWNATQLGQTANTPKVIVPLIVYLNNDSGNDKKAPQRDITGESLVPPLAKLRAGSGGVVDDTTLQRSADLVEVERICPPEEAECRAAVESLPRRIFMVYPSSKPQIAAPLGWILSQSSRDSMDAAIGDQAAYGCDDQNHSVQVNNVVCRRGFGTLHDLLTAVQRR